MGPPTKNSVKYWPTQEKSLEISIDEIKRREEPYQIFLDSLQNHETKRRYINNNQNFLEMIPNEIYKKSLGRVPRNRRNNTLANIFVKLAAKDNKIVRIILLGLPRIELEK